MTVGSIGSGAGALEVIPRHECLDLLAGEQVGRLAVMVGNYPQVFPVNYRMDDFVVVFRTRPGTKLGAAHHSNVAFEVDSYDTRTRTGWSVLVQGMAEDLVVRAPDEVTERARALGVEPWPAGEDLHLVRVIPARMTGRRITAATMDWYGDEGA